MEIKCAECGWEGDWDGTITVKVDGDKHPGCPKCKGIEFLEQGDLFGPDLSKPPCQECGAMTPEEAATKCHCGGDKDDCHGCHLWPD